MYKGRVGAQKAGEGGGGEGVSVVAVLQSMLVVEQQIPDGEQCDVSKQNHFAGDSGQHETP